MSSTSPLSPKHLVTPVSPEHYVYDSSGSVMPSTLGRESFLFGATTYCVNFQVGVVCSGSTMVHDCGTIGQVRRRLGVV